MAITRISLKIAITTPDNGLATTISERDDSNLVVVPVEEDSDSEIEQQPQQQSVTTNTSISIDIDIDIDEASERIASVVSKEMGQDATGDADEKINAAIASTAATTMIASMMSSLGFQ